MANWFSTYQKSDWTPSNGYNETFRELILMTRAWFGLQKVKPGVEKGTDHWIDYNLQGEDVEVCMLSLDWGGYIKRDGYITPVFVFEFLIRKLGKKKPFYKQTFQFEFPPDYPSTEPWVRGKSYKEYGPSHSHHLNSNGYLCINDAGNTSWNEEKSSIITVFNWAFDWAVMHYNKFQF